MYHQPFYTGRPVFFISIVLIKSSQILFKQLKSCLLNTITYKSKVNLSIAAKPTQNRGGGLWVQLYHLIIGGDRKEKRKTIFFPPDSGERQPLVGCVNTIQQEWKVNIFSNCVLWDVWFADVNILLQIESNCCKDQITDTLHRVKIIFLLAHFVKYQLHFKMFQTNLVDLD
jgi:hypothetical protein